MQEGHWFWRFASVVSHSAGWQSRLLQNKSFPRYCKFHLNTVCTFFAIAKDMNLAMKGWVSSASYYCQMVSHSLAVKSELYDCYCKPLSFPWQLILMLKKIVLNIIMVHGYPASEGCEGKCWFHILRKESMNVLLLVTRMMIAEVIIKSKIKLIQEMLQRGQFFIILSPVQ